MRQEISGKNTIFFNTDNSIYKNFELSDNQLFMRNINDEYIFM